MLATEIGQVQPGLLESLSQKTKNPEKRKKRERKKENKEEEEEEEEKGRRERRKREKDCWKPDLVEYLKSRYLGVWETEEGKARSVLAWTTK